MNFINKCKERFDSLKTVLCIGFDPVIEKIPFKRKDNIKKTLINFYFSIIENFHKYALAVKPNIAFYEQYGIDGLKALKEIIKKSKIKEIPVILDAKRGDIGETAKAYAIAAFNEFDADAVTLSPYLGLDSLEPFFKFIEKGFFILARTSNKSSNDLQLIKTIDNRFIYQEITDKIIQWNKTYSSNIGAVAGATHIEELKEIVVNFNKESGLPILIPGVGKQGGSFNEVIDILKEINYPLYKVFINSSSNINYAYLNYPDMNYLEASLFEIKKMQLQ